MQSAGSGLVWTLLLAIGCTWWFLDQRREASREQLHQPYVTDYEALSKEAAFDERTAGLICVEAGWEGEDGTPTWDEFEALLRECGMVLEAGPTGDAKR